MFFPIFKFNTCLNKAKNIKNSFYFFSSFPALPALRGGRGGRGGHRANKKDSVVPCTSILYRYLEKDSNKKNFLTLYNNSLGISSLVKKSKLTNVERKWLCLTPKLESILIGLLLSDGWLQKRAQWNPRFGLKQSLKNFPFLWSCFEEFAYLCSGYPYLGKSHIRGKLFYSISFQTRQLECFNEVFNLFYKTVNGKRVKQINQELLHYMNYSVLAFWIMGDGNKQKKGLEINTQSYTLNEVILLVNILRIKFNLNPGIHVSRPDTSIYKIKANSLLRSDLKTLSCAINYKIYLNSVDLNKIKPFIKPYFVKHFLYKIN